MPGPSRRSAPRGGPSDRRAGAHRPRRTRQAGSTRRLARRVSWSRRIGVAAALLLMIGGSIAFASQAFDSGAADRAPAPTPPPPPAATLLTPADTLVAAPSIDLLAARPAGLRRDQSYRVRIYVNGEAVRDRALPEADEFTLASVPLVEGSNTITVALVGSGGEGAPSAAVVVVRDTVAPLVRVTRPAPDAVLYDAAAILAGRTEPGADLTLTRPGSGDGIAATVAADGRFEASLSLGVGRNQFVLVSRDGAGNESRTRITLERAVTDASLSVHVAPAELTMAGLPRDVEVEIVVRDERGRPADGAQVVLSISPPNQPTSTFRATTAEGRARFGDIDVPESPASGGTWLVAVHVVLPSGQQLRDDASFSVE